MVSGIVSIGSVFGILLGLLIIKLIKEMRNESRDNTKIIKDLFSERWDRAEAMFRNQAREINIPRSRDPQPTSEVLTFTVNGASLTNENLHGRNKGIKPRSSLIQSVKSMSLSNSMLICDVNK